MVEPEQAVETLKKGYDRLDAAITYMKEELKSYECPEEVFLQPNDPVITEIGWGKPEEDSYTRKRNIVVRHREQQIVVGQERPRTSIDGVSLKVKMAVLRLYPQLRKAVIERVAFVGPELLRMVESFIYENFEEVSPEPEQENDTRIQRKD